MHGTPGPSIGNSDRLWHAMHTSGRQYNFHCLLEVCPVSNRYKDRPGAFTCPHRHSNHLSSFPYGRKGPSFWSWDFSSSYQQTVSYSDAWPVEEHSQVAGDAAVSRMSIAVTMQHEEIVTTG
jgi:hypothetical protein